MSPFASNSTSTYKSHRLYLKNNPHSASMPSLLVFFSAIYMDIPFSASQVDQLKTTTTQIRSPRAEKPLTAPDCP